jgi:hypothetical protein
MLQFIPSGDLLRGGLAKPLLYILLPLSGL